jgi:hypothetical protein
VFDGDKTMTGVRIACAAFATLVMTMGVAAQTPINGAANTANAATAAPVGPSVTLPPGAKSEAGCNSVEKPLSAGGASIVPETVGQRKTWQPPGGEIEFVIRSFVTIPADALVIVCFRWERTSELQGVFISTRPVHLDLSDGGRLLKVTAVVPPGLRNAPSRLSGEGRYVGLWLVPLADVRIMVLGKDGAGGYTIAADVSHAIGVTNPFWAFALALFTVLAAFVVLSIICHRRLRRTGIAKTGMLIRIITTPEGYASLSQLQIVLWTFVVAGSAVYVMVLSGELIQITTGTLVLLGISGAVSVLSRWQDATQAPVDAPPRLPRWSDLVVNDVNDHREIDVTRVQMLYFTVITAIFVVMKVLTSYVIPEIPEGFQVLMGISNAVYVGSKAAPKPAASDAAPAATAATPDPSPMPPTPAS